MTTIQGLLRENNMAFSEKGKLCIIKAIKDYYPILQSIDERITSKYIWCYELNDEDCLAILHLASRYAKLWAFS